MSGRVIIQSVSLPDAMPCHAMLVNDDVGNSLLGCLDVELKVGFLYFI